MSELKEVCKKAILNIDKKNVKWCSEFSSMECNVWLVSLYRIPWTISTKLYLFNDDFKWELEKEWLTRRTFLIMNISSPFLLSGYWHGNTNCIIRCFLYLPRGKNTFTPFIHSMRFCCISDYQNSHLLVPRYFEMYLWQISSVKTLALDTESVIVVSATVYKGLVGFNTGNFNLVWINYANAT